MHVLLFLFHLCKLISKTLVLEDEIQNVSEIESDVVTTVIVLEVEAVGSHYLPWANVILYWSDMAVL